MRAIGILVSGASGRMGQEIITLARGDENFEVLAEISRSSKTKTLSEVDPEKIDAVIDFSSPDFLPDLLRWVSDHKLPLVTGTTGFSKENFNRIRDVSREVPILWSANMSPGIALLGNIIKELAKLEDFDFQIEETHHRLKKDRPSGTALYLQQKLKQALRNVEIPDPLVIRGGGVIGEHRILAMSEEETLLFQHTAINRSVFAKGALLATKWLVRRKPGLFSMEDVFSTLENK